MKKEEFLKELRLSLKQFSEAEVKDILGYYNEMISDRTEQGTPEEEVIESLGDIKVISSRIQPDLMSVRLMQPESGKSIVKASNNFLIVLMLCASPALIPLGIAFLSVFLSLAITLVALIASFGITAVALILSIIPVIYLSYFNAGIGGAIFSGGVVLIITGVFVLLTILLSSAGSKLLNEIIKAVNKIINKYKRGHKND